MRLIRASPDSIITVSGRRKKPSTISFDGATCRLCYHPHTVIDSHQSRLDHGGGKDLSLPECSREQLEKQV